MPANSENSAVATGLEKVSFHSNPKEGNAKELLNYGTIAVISHASSKFPKPGFGIVNKAEIDVFLELSCFFDDPVDVGNLISGSSAFPKTSLNIWKFMVHILLKPGLENFEHYFTSV